jgi:hypothetical protein
MFTLVESKYIFKKTKMCTPGFEDVMVKIVELPKNPNVVGCKDLQEGGRHSEG